MNDVLVKYYHRKQLGSAEPAIGRKWDGFLSVQSELRSGVMQLGYHFVLPFMAIVNIIVCGRCPYLF